ncbi:hypothetical protein [Catenibacterium sp. co_0103]|uniref:hypothetical protein n=1 Tax=Catenibacterium sp. co_0103 TaxID=2478954 RepID=UPI0024792007|nr:hypothetical protein [Catenibacterium sp. co_0103]
MSKMNVMKKIQEMRGKINIYYDMDIEDMEKIYISSNDSFFINFKCFYLWLYSRNESPEGKRQKEKSIIIFIL